VQVTNVRVANDAREVKRRKDGVAAREKRIKRLEDQANESSEKFNEVSSRWKAILELNDPLDLHHAIEEQKGKSMWCTLLYVVYYLNFYTMCLISPLLAISLH
jgi:hypothetical protein